jgi:hypothetical protein
MSRQDIEKALRKLGAANPRFVIYNSVKEINPIEWNALAQDAAPMMH